VLFCISFPPARIETVELVNFSRSTPFSNFANFITRFYFPTPNCTEMVIKPYSLEQLELQVKVCDGIISVSQYKAVTNVFRKKKE